MSGNEGMSIRMSKGRWTLFAITAFMLNMVAFGENGTMPVVNNLYETFGFGFIGNYIVSGAPLWMAVASVVAGRLMAHVTKKKMLLAGSLVFAIGSICCGMVENGLYVAFMRTLMGIGEGFINATIFAYITQLYVDVERRAWFTGMFNAAAMVVGAALSYTSGRLSVPVWTHAFMAYWPMVLVVVSVALFVPELGMEDFSFEDPLAQESDTRQKLGPLFVPFLIDYLLFCSLYAAIAYFISIYVVETGIGDAALAGTLLSVATLAGIVTSVSFAKIYGALSKSTATLCLVVGVVGILALYLVHNVAVAFVAVFLVGASYGAYYTYSMVYIPQIVPASRVADAISYTMAAYAVLLFCIPFAASFLAEHVTGGSYLGVYLCVALLGCVGIVIEVATNGLFQRHVQGRSN